MLRKISGRLDLLLSEKCLFKLFIKVYRTESFLLATENFATKEMLLFQYHPSQWLWKCR